MAKIEFENKQALNENANIPDINKVKDSDLNEIKNVVNQTILNSLFGVYYDSWSSSGTYSIGDIVIYDAILYENLTGNNTATTPDQDSTNWQVVNILLNSKVNPKLIDKTDFIKNASNNSQTDTYSCDYINDCNVYSTSETFTGKYWVDGKPIYRKIVVVDELPDNTAATYSSGITDSVDKMLNITGTAMSKNTFTNAFPLPYIDKYSGSNNNIELVWLGTSKEVRITTDTNRTTLCAYIFLEYTKTN